MQPSTWGSADCAVRGWQEACTLAKRCLKRARQRGASRQAAARIAATVLTRAAIDRGSRYCPLSVLPLELSAYLALGGTAGRGLCCQQPLFEAPRLWWQALLSTAI